MDLKTIVMLLSILSCGLVVHLAEGNFIEFAGIVVNQGGLIGASAQISIHNPKSVTSGQFSAASIIIESGGDQLEAGWIVNPDLFHDGQTRLYTHWKSGSGGCFNTDCPGFVIASDIYPLGYVFPQISDPNTGERHDVEITIQRGDVIGDWYLDVDGKTIGFWRGPLLGSLQNSASTIRFGGQVLANGKAGASPQMGSGFFYNFNPSRTAYMQNVQILPGGGTFTPPPQGYSVRSSRCYITGSDAYSGGDLNGYHFLFGGAGGPAGVCV